MKKILIVPIIVIISLIAFFFPKNAGFTCGFCAGPPSISRTEYGCIGFKVDIPPGLGCMDCGTSITCFGIVTQEKKCYTNLNGLVEVPNCKNPETWEEILAICNKGGVNCYGQAAMAAYKQNDLNKAIEFCNLIESKEFCLKSISNMALSENKVSEAETICLNLDKLKDLCIEGVAGKLAESNVDRGLNKCLEIQNTKEKDNCYHNIAVITRAINITKALEICNLIKEDTSVPPCKELIQNYCTIYPGSVSC